MVLSDIFACSRMSSTLSWRWKHAYYYIALNLLVFVIQGEMDYLVSASQKFEAMLEAALVSPYKFCM
jgi:hypothetical protein